MLVKSTPALMLLMRVAEFLMAKAKKEQKTKWLNTSVYISRKAS